MIITNWIIIAAFVADVDLVTYFVAIVTMDVILVMEQSGNIRPLHNQNVEVPSFMRIQMILRAMKVAVLNMI